MPTNTGANVTYRQGVWAPGLDVAVGDLDADGDADAFVYERAFGKWSVASRRRQGAPASYDRVLIEGSPRIASKIEGGVHGDIACG